MSLKVLLVYSLLSNVALVGAVCWQQEERRRHVEDEQAFARDQTILFHQHVVRCLATEDPVMRDNLAATCRNQLAVLRPQMETIWDPMK